MVKVVATVAEEGRYSTATASHNLTLTRLANTLTLTLEGGGDLPGTLEIDATHDFAATRLGTGAITWSVTDTDDAATDLATIDETTGILISNKGGRVKVVATVGQDDQYETATATHPLEIILLTSDLAFTSTVDELDVNASHTFTVSTDSTGAITWGVTNIDVAGTDTGRAEINDSGQLTALKGTGMVRITASVVADDRYAAGSAFHDVTLNLLDSDLDFASTIDELDVNANHTFTVTKSNSGLVAWEVTNIDGTSTDRAEINDSGQLTALKGTGMVRVTASVAADDRYAAGSAFHDVTLNRLDSDLAFNSTVDELDVNTNHTFTVSTDSTGAITWEVTNTDGSSTDRAEISNSGQLTGLKGTGMVRVTASVAADDTYAVGSAFHDVTINRLDATITFGAYSRSISENAAPVTLTATTNSGATITWSGSNASAATITDNRDNTATLTPVAVGILTVTAAVAETDTHTAGSVTSDEITINNLQSPNLTITGSPPATLVIMETHTFTATRDSGGAITWIVINPDGSEVERATIDETSGVLNALAAGPVQVVATVAAAGTYSSATSSHDLALTRLANTLALTSEGGGDLPGTLEVDATHDFAATRLGTGAITWSVTDTDDGATDLATIDDTTGVLTSNKGGRVKVVATVAEDGQYEAATATHTLELTRLANTLAFTSPAATVQAGESATFAATHSGSEAITWSVTGTDDLATDLATIDDTTGMLTANKGGMVKVVATVAADDRYAGTTASHDLTLTRIAATITFADYSRSLLRNASPVTLTATTNSGATITWSGSNASAATLTDNGDGTATLTPMAAGTLMVTATVAETDTHAAGSATTDKITINDLGSPNLMISGSPPATLAVMGTHTFTATRSGSGAITWSVTGTDDGATDLATINPTTGMLTANKGGMVKVVATVAEEGRYSTATASHDLTITRLANTLTLTSPAATVEVGGNATFTATRLGTGAITWSVTGTDDGATDLATLHPTTGVLTANKRGMVKVVATVAQDDQYEAATATHTLDITRLANTLTLTSPATTVQVGGSATFTATRLGSGAITWSVTGTDDGATDLATINENTGVLTAHKSGMVKVIASVVADDIYSATTISHDLTITRIPNTVTFTSPVTHLQTGEMADFDATSSNSGAPVIWSVTGTDDLATDLATINHTTGQLTANQGGVVKVVATVEQDDTYGAATGSHAVIITRLPANLRFSESSPTRLRTGSDQTAQLIVTRDGEGAITWSIVEETTAATISDTGLVTAGTTAETITVQAVVAATMSHATEARTTTLKIADFVDFDGDGLIEIYDLAMLHNMRHNLSGSSYKATSSEAGISTGCPMGDSMREVCTGYELMNDLDFDRDGDGRTWDSTTLALDAGDTQAPYFDTANGGWLPIGTGNGSSTFSATFEGNGFVIRNLAIRRNQGTIGLFGSASRTTIRNLGLEQVLADYTGTGINTFVAPLVGQMDGGHIIASYASGRVDGGGGTEIMGGLVGANSGAITASYSTTTVDGPEWC